MIYRARTEELWQVPELLITILPVPDTFTSQERSQFTERFYAQGRKLARLRHPHLYPLYGYGEQEGFFYFLSPPLARRETLAGYARRNGPQSLENVLSILLPLVSVVDYLHSQTVAYPFLNPEHIIVLSDQTVLLNGLELVLILTLQALPLAQPQRGAYRHLKDISGLFLGVPEYLAPEAVRGTEVSSSADIYALGILLFELLGGCWPFQGDDYRDRLQKHLSQPLPSLHEISVDLPVALDIVINRATHYNMSYRFKTARELADAYTAIVNVYLDTPKPGSLIKAIEQAKVLPLPEARRLLPPRERSALVRVDEQVERDAVLRVDEEIAREKAAEIFETLRGGEVAQREEEGSGEKTPQGEQAVEEDEHVDLVADSFLLEGEDSLFGLDKGAFIEEDTFDALFVTSKKHAIVARSNIPAEPLTPVPGEIGDANTPLAARPETSLADQAEQTLHSRIGTMASQFHQLKERLQAQAQAMADSAYTAPNKIDT